MSLLKIIVNDQTNMIFYFFLGLVVGITASLIVYLADKYIKYLLKQSLHSKLEEYDSSKDSPFLRL